jgi:hypothetical protein
MRVPVLALALGIAIALPSFADDVGPAQEQQLRDARAAIDAARRAKADQFAAPQLKLAEETLQVTEDARKQKDGERFGRAAMLARAQAELAQAMSELALERQNLASTNEAIGRARADIERLGKPN